MRVDRLLNMRSPLPITPSPKVRTFLLMATTLSNISSSSSSPPRRFCAIDDDLGGGVSKEVLLLLDNLEARLISSLSSVLSAYNLRTNKRSLTFFLTSLLSFCAFLDLFFCLCCSNGCNYRHHHLHRHHYPCS